MQIDPKIFRPYDIRGLYPEQIDKDTAYWIGRAFAYFIEGQTIAVGHDVRLSSPVLAENLIAGLIDQGVDVIDIGVISSPMLSWLVAEKGLDGGAMVTASHNPKEYNGFKLVRQKALALTDVEIKRLQVLLIKKDWDKSEVAGYLKKDNILNEYIDSLLKENSFSINSFKIVADAANSVGGLILPKFFKKLDCQFSCLFCDLDGHFPNHLPNPLEKKNVEDLQKEVLSQKADLGIAVDGDVDRLIFIDEQGEVVRADLITALLAEYFLKKNKEEKILCDVRSSRVVEEVIFENGGEPVISKVGHSFIKQKMHEDDVIFGGEVSGHYYFKRESFYYESPLKAILIVLNLMSEQKKTLSELLMPFKRYCSSGEINFTLGNKELALQKAEETYKQGSVDHLDGLTVEFDDWWFNLRSSNTEPLLRLNIEADSQGLLQEKIKELRKIIESID